MNRKEKKKKMQGSVNRPLQKKVIDKEAVMNWKNENANGEKTKMVNV